MPPDTYLTERDALADPAADGSSVRTDTGEQTQNDDRTLSPRVRLHS